MRTAQALAATVDETGRPLRFHVADMAADGPPRRYDRAAPAADLAQIQHTRAGESMVDLFKPWKKRHL